MENIMSKSKICKNCKYFFDYSNYGRYRSEIYLCSVKSQIETEDLVTGETMFPPMVSCDSMRINEDECGGAGKYFVSKK